MIKKLLIPTKIAILHQFERPIQQKKKQLINNNNDNNTKKQNKSRYFACNAVN